MYDNILPIRVIHLCTKGVTKNVEISRADIRTRLSFVYDIMIHHWIVLQELSEKTLLKDITDKELPAVEVFAAVIRYFMEKLQTRSTTGSLYDFTYDDVYWVITVPAIWDLRAKQFMRKAAEKVVAIYKLKLHE